MIGISRREMLAGMVALGLGQMLPGKAVAAERHEKKKVIVTGGHPGDPEYGCGGTIARLTDAGDEVALLYLNQGDPKATAADNPKAPRVAEASKACAILKARPLYAGQIDGHAIIDAEHYEEFRRLIEREQPDAVFTHWPIDNHAYHRAMSLLVYEAWLKMRKKFALFYYEVSDGEDTVQFSPTIYVDITETAAQKRSACYAHASQAPGKFYALQEMVTRMRGIESGHRQAEGFVRHIQSPAFPLPTN